MLLTGQSKYSKSQVTRQAFFACHSTIPTLAVFFIETFARLQSFNWLYKAYATTSLPTFLQGFAGHNRTLQETTGIGLAALEITKNVQFGPHLGYS
jgi:hypothetical protein